MKRLAIILIILFALPVFALAGQYKLVTDKESGTIYIIDKEGEDSFELENGRKVFDIDEIGERRLRLAVNDPDTLEKVDYNGDVTQEMEGDPTKFTYDKKDQTIKPINAALGPGE